MKETVLKFGFGELRALMACVLAACAAHTARAGLTNGGNLPAAGSTLQAGKFYTLTGDTTISGKVTAANPNGSGFIMPANGKVAINLDGYKLTVNGAAGSKTLGGGAGIQMSGGSTLYICGNGGQFVANGGAAANGAKGLEGSSFEWGGSGKSLWIRSGAGGGGGDGGGGAGAGVGTAGGAGGSGGGSGGNRAEIHEGGGSSNGGAGGKGGNGNSAASGDFTLVCVSTLKSKTLTGGSSGLGGEGGASGGDGFSKGANGRFYHCGAGGGGGGGGGGLAGAKFGTGGGGGGQGGGGGGGGVDSNKEKDGNRNMRAGGNGGKGGCGIDDEHNGKNGKTAVQQNQGNNGWPGDAGDRGAAGVKCSEKTVGAKAPSEYADLKYTPALDRQGGAGGSASATCYLGETPASITPPTRTGYIFGGYWTEAKGAGTQVFDKDGAATGHWNLDSATLYAKWTPITYEVVYNGNGNTGGNAPAKQTWTYDAEAKTAANPFSRTGYLFDGWNTKSDGTGAAYDANKTAYKNLTAVNGGTVTLYVKWKAITYTVVYNGNGNTGGTAPKSQTWTYDTDAKTAANTFSRTGYTFIGWNGKQDGSGTDYNANNTAYKNLTTTSGGTVTMYAMWKANSYTVKFDQNGGIGGQVGDKTATYDSQMPDVTAPTLAGKMFRGYFDAKTGGTKYYYGDGRSARTWNKAANTTLYAQWKDAAEFDAVPSGYTRVGAVRSSGNQYVDTLYVHTPNTRVECKVDVATSQSKTWAAIFGARKNSYMSNAFVFFAKHGNESQSCYCRTGDEPSCPAFPRNQVVDLICDGQSATWTDASGSRTKTKTFGKLDAGANTMFLFNLNTGDAGGKTADASFITMSLYSFRMYEGASKPLLMAGANSGGAAASYDASLVRNFIPCTDSNGKTGFYDPVTELFYVHAAGSAFAAVNPDCEVTFNTVGGTGGTPGVTATFAKAMPTVEPPVLTGYAFAGYVDANGKAYYKADGTSAALWDKLPATTLHAVWTAKSYTLTLDSGDGEEPTTATVTFDQIPTKITPPPGGVRKFSGYFTEPDGAGTRVFDEYGVATEPWTTDGDVTLYASWLTELCATDPEATTADFRAVKPTQVFLTETLTASTNGWTDGVESAAILVAAGAGGFETLVDPVSSSEATWSPQDVGLYTFRHTTDEGTYETAQFNVTGFVYQVAFDANGGEGEMEPEEAIYGTPKALPACAYETLGHHFTGWTTNEASGVVWPAGTEVLNLTREPGATVVLSATWNPNPYTLNYLFVRDGEHATTNLVWGNEHSVLAQPFDWTSHGFHYAFTGWLSSADGKIHLPDEAVSNLTSELDGSVDFTAQWIAPGDVRNPMPIGGAQPEDVLAWTNGTQLLVTPARTRVSTEALLRARNLLGRWPTGGDFSFVLADGSTNQVMMIVGSDGRIYDDLAALGAADPQPASAYLYEVACGVVVYDGAGARGEMDQDVFMPDETTNLTACAFTAIGYEFAGWTTNGTDKAFDDRAEVMNIVVDNKTIVLKALWNQVKIDIADYATLTNVLEQMTFPVLAEITADVEFPEGAPDAVLAQDMSLTLFGSGCVKGPFLAFGDLTLLGAVKFDCLDMRDGAKVNIADGTGNVLEAQARIKVKATPAPTWGAPVTVAEGADGYDACFESADPDQIVRIVEDRVELHGRGETEDFPWIAGDGVTAWLGSDDHRLLFEGEGEVGDAADYPPWACVSNVVTCVDVTNAVTRLGDNALRDMKNLAEVRIHKGEDDPKLNVKAFGPTWQRSVAIRLREGEEELTPVSLIGSTGAGYATVEDAWKAGEGEVTVRSGAFYTLTFDGRGAVGTMLGQYVFMDEPTPIRDCTFEAVGYRQLGWGTNSNAMAQLEPGAVVSNLVGAGKSISLKAIWEQVELEFHNYEEMSNAVARMSAALPIRGRIVEDITFPEGAVLDIPSGKKVTLVGDKAVKGKIVVNATGGLTVGGGVQLDWVYLKNNVVVQAGTGDDALTEDAMILVETQTAPTLYNKRRDIFNTSAGAMAAEAHFGAHDPEKYGIYRPNPNVLQLVARGDEKTVPWILSDDVSAYLSNASTVNVVTNSGAAVACAVEALPDGMPWATEYDATKIKTVNVDPGILEIGERVFAGMTNLERINFGSQGVALPSAAFDEDFLANLWERGFNSSGTSAGANQKVQDLIKVKSRPTDADYKNVVMVIQEDGTQITTDDVSYPIPQALYVNDAAIAYCYADKGYWVGYDKGETDETTASGNPIKGSMVTDLFLPDKEGTLSANAYTLEDFAFVGWTNRVAGAGGKWYADKATVMNLADPGQSVTLYATWKRTHVWVTALTCENATYSVYTNGVAIAEGVREGSRYRVENLAPVTVVYRADLGFAFDKNGKSGSVELNPATFAVRDAVKPEDLPTLIRIGDVITMDDIDMEPDGTIIIKSSDTTADGVLIIPDVINTQTVKGIAAKACYGYSWLKEIDLSAAEHVESIGRQAFAWCTQLRKFTMPPNLKTLGESAFDMCGMLEGVVLPASLTELGANAFVRCYSLTSVEFKGATPPAITGTAGYAMFYGADDFTLRIGGGSDAWATCVNGFFSQNGMKPWQKVSQVSPGVFSCVMDEAVVTPVVKSMSVELDNLQVGVDNPIPDLWYTLERCTELGGPWTAVETVKGDAAIGGMLTFTCPTETSSGFFRIVVTDRAPQN